MPALLGWAIVPPSWIAPVAGLAAFLLVLAGIALAPAQAARLSLSTWQGVPEGARSSLPPESDRIVRDRIDDSTRFFAFGDPDRLVQARVRLTEGSAPPEQWLPSRDVSLAWTDLGSPSIRYALFVGEDAEVSQATAAGVVGRPSAKVEVPGDGKWTVWVRPQAEKTGLVSSLGTFWVDASPPPTPVVPDREDPPGYRFELAWDEVEDLSSIDGYEVQRRLGAGTWETVGEAPEARWLEDQLGNGEYGYRVRARNGAGVVSEWSEPIDVVVKAPMTNPGPGQFDFGLQVNYTGFLNLWDLSDPSRYVTLAQLPPDVKAEYLGEAPAVETSNETLRALVRQHVGGETNTLEIAEILFRYLFDATDYNSSKPSDPNSRLQRAGETLDRKGGICGDLAVLYLTLLRIAGVPARPVHGYLDNARSGIGGFHMWVEVYVGPADATRPWMTVDVSGVTGSYTPEQLFAYFGVFNPDYLSLGHERAYDRFTDDQWNTWARFRYSTLEGDPRPRIEDRTRVDDYESEYGRLFFNTETRKSVYQACAQPDSEHPDDPCPDERGPAGFNKYYGVKGVSKKRIDYGADLETSLPRCLKVELRYPVVDAYGALTPDQSAIYRVYENHPATTTKVGSPDKDGWIVFEDGTHMGTSCDGL